MNSYYNKKEFNEWIMLYLLDAMNNFDYINADGEPEWASFINFLKSRDGMSTIRLMIPQMSTRIKTYAKPPIKAVKEATENIRILT